MNIYKKYDQAPNKGRITGVEIFKHMTYSNWTSWDIKLSVYKEEISISYKMFIATSSKKRCSKANTLYIKGSWTDKLTQNINEVEDTPQ
jgi:hypothetical protein